MKEIMAFIRRHQVPATKKAFEDAGYPALTIQSVEGRGKQGGIGGWAAEVDPELNFMLSKELADDTAFNWIPKRMGFWLDRGAMHRVQRLRRHVCWIKRGGRIVTDQILNHTIRGANHTDISGMIRYLS